MTDDAAIRTLVTRLARPRAAGGHTIDRASLLAEGADFEAIEAWIISRGGTAEAVSTPTASAGGLHGLRSDASTHRSATRPPARYELPAGALASTD